MTNLLYFLLALCPTIIYYAVRKPIQTNYELQKDFKLKGVKTSALPVEVIRKVNDIDEKRLLEQQFGSYIIEFINTIMENIPDSNLTLFYNNMNGINTTIGINEKIRKASRYTELYGVYLCKENEIQLSPNCHKSTIFHELLHASTSYIDENFIHFVGFEQVNNGNIIGEGLNEGYTQYLTEKFFNSSSESYIYEKRIAEILEIIVGKEMMQSLYFNANLKGLVDVLKQYNTEENVYNFITTLDFLNKHMADGVVGNLTTDSKQIILNSLKSVNIFLIETYLKKIILENPTEIIDNREILEKSIPLLTKIPTGINMNGHEIGTMDAKSMIQIAKDFVSVYEHEEKINSPIK